MRHFQERLDGERKIEEMCRATMSRPPDMTPAEVDRLYWFEGWSLRQLGAHFHRTNQTIHAFMVRHGIPRRKAGERFRNTGQCVEDGCTRPVCEIKRWYDSGYRWIRTSRCLIHHTLWRRAITRRVARRYHGWQRSYAPRKQQPIRETAWARRAS